MTPARDDRLLRRAVRENASWCALGCASRGVGSGDDGRVWTATGPPPPYYPDAMTLAPGTTADEVLARVGGRRPAGVKDSFAEIDLRAAGFDVLFEASWIAVTGRVPEPSAGSHQAQEQPDGPDVVSLQVVRDGAVVGSGTGHRHGGVIGLADVEADVDADGRAHPREVFAALVHGVRDRLGDLPVVGYEHGAALDAAVAAGFSALGPLRIWVRPGSGGRPPGGAQADDEG